MLMHSMTDGQIWAMGIGMAVWLAVLVGFGVWLVNRFTRRPRANEGEQILRERFARGEIDETELRPSREALARSGE